MSGIVGYNPSDPIQSSFLASIAKGESGGSSNPYSVGFGGVNLSGASTNQYGFPQWGGAYTPYGPTHAAGAFQFQPGTWNSIAQQYGLNFQNPQDQNAGAWYLAQQNYTARTGGSLEDALQAGNYSSVGTALNPTWTSLTPQSLATNMNSGATLPDAGSLTTQGDATLGVPPSGVVTDPYGGSLTGNQTGQITQSATNVGKKAKGPDLQVGVQPSLSSAIGGWITSAENTFGSVVKGAVSSVVSPIENLVGRGFLIIVSALLITLALWIMLSKTKPAQMAVKVVSAVR